MKVLVQRYQRKTAPLKEPIQQFKDAFKDEIVKGDRFVIAYTKAREQVFLKW